MTFLHKLAKRLALVPVAMVPLGLLAGCGDASQQDYLGPNPQKPSSSTFIGLSITPHDPQIVMGDSVRLTAQGWLSNGLSQPASVSWSASSGSVSASGWYRPVSTGAFRVRAQVVGSVALADSVLVTVISPAGIARLDVTPGTASLSSGSRQQFTAVALMENGTQVLPTVVWSATGGSISSTGLFTAGPATQGGYIVTASLGDGAITGVASGAVEAAELTQLSISPAAVQLESSASQQFSVTASWTDGSSALPALEWSATGGEISPVGGYTAGSTPGTYRVIVRSPALGKADTSLVTILPRVVSLRLAPLTAALALEATQVLTAYAQRSDGSEAPVAVQWSAEGGSISLGGAYTAGTVPGSYSVTGTLTSVSGQAFSAQAQMQVGPEGDEPAGGVQLIVAPDTTIAIGTSNRFRVAVVGGGTVPAVIWSATGGSIDQTGLYTAGQSTGSYRVIAKKRTGQSKPDTAAVNLVAAPVLSIAGFTLSPQSDIIGQGQSRQFSATLNWSDGLSHPANITYVAAGGSITPNGLYTAGSIAGTFSVIAICSCGVADTSSVSIPISAAAPITLSRVILTPPTSQLAAGEAQQFSVSGQWSDGATSPPPVSYYAEGGSITQSGLYVASNVAGTYKVIATHTTTPLADTSFVTIAAPAAQLSQLVMNPSAVSIPQGSTQAFAVSALWSDGSTTLPPLTFDPTGGTVTADGVYTAGSTPGTFRLIVRHTGGTKADTSVITIPASVTLTQFVLNPSSISLVPGATQQFQVSGLWSDGSTTAPAVSWNVTGGSISQGGLYTAGSVGGTFRVIASHTGGTKADTSAVIVTVAAPPPPPPPPSGVIMPELPRVYINSAYVAPTGTVINVPAGGDLQGALNSATCGADIRLAAGATYTGHYVLPTRSCASNPIHIRTAGVLPPEGVRITPATAAGFAKIVTTNYEPAIEAGRAAHGYRITAVEVTIGLSATFSYGIVTLGAIEPTLADMPGDIIVDRSYVHGNATVSVARCIGLNGTTMAVVDSYLSECHGNQQDAQAIASWNTPGPLKIVNNYLEGSGENVIFGGADPTVQGVTPSDIELRRNHIAKPSSWLGGPWQIKNSLEMKNARRVLVEGNVFDNNWAQAQDGFAIVLASMNQSGTAPWSTVQDITFRYNRLRASGSGMALSARGMPNSTLAARIAIIGNLFEDVGRSDRPGEGRMLHLLDALSDVTVAHNTFLHAGAGTHNSAVVFDYAPITRLIMIDNIFTLGTYGVVGGNVGGGSVALNYYAPGGTFTGNAMAITVPMYDQANIASYFPAGNSFANSLALLGLDPTYRLNSWSTLKGKATDGGDPGVNIDLLNSATQSVAP